MSLVDRVKNILLTPKTEWPLIAAEPATTQGLFTGYAIPVSLLPLIGALIAGLLFNGTLATFGIGFILVPAIAGWIIGLAILYVMSLIADALAPSFDGTKGPTSALKLVIYSATPIWVAGFFGFIPGLSVILTLLGFAYSAYLLYLGAMAAMRVPETKAPGYTAVVIVIWIVLSMVVSGLIVGAIVTSYMSSAVLGGGMIR